MYACADNKAALRPIEITPKVSELAATAGMQNSVSFGVERLSSKAFAQSTVPEMAMPPEDDFVLRRLRFAYSTMHYTTEISPATEFLWRSSLEVNC